MKHAISPFLTVYKEIHSLALVQQVGLACLLLYMYVVYNLHTCTFL